MQAEVSPPECKLIARTRLENSMVQFQMLAINVKVSLLGWLFILEKGSNMKQTKDVALVSCGLEEYLINKLDRETSKKDGKK
ncbi:hypothetical protein M5361_15010 [Ligilactobacillus agilis]|nr:hypothetical protein [Ligilactobacillus agilis]MCL8205248.1 hypothetical protein [Ligilactobacillus agilis]MCL8206439.1 hypothetical protein [Ligilactobacillus agilis]